MTVPRMALYPASGVMLPSMGMALQRSVYSEKECQFISTPYSSRSAFAPASLGNSSWGIWK